MLQKLSQAVFRGVSWKHPVVAAGLRILDPVDYGVRALKRRGQFPRLSKRVRSNGLRGQFGGEKFERMGKTLADELQLRAALTRDSKVLEIGCGCGRAAFALADRLADGGYAGVDIDLPSVEAARSNAFLRRHGFTFDHLDVQNAEYNPDGKHDARSYKFGFPDQSFDVIFLISVFTHMLPEDVSNYIAEIGRLLRPGGRVMFSTFLMDPGTHFGGLEFPYGNGPYRSAHAEIPEICVGYFLPFFDEEFARAGLERTGAPAYSRNRRDMPTGDQTSFGQDIVTAEKRK